MVKKLIMHEFNSYLKIILLVDAVLIGIAAITRIVQIFESDTLVYSILNISTIVILCLSMVVGAVMTLALVIVRFYKNMFTSEGYLTLTLPVTHSQHIFTKLLCAVTFYVITAISIIAAVFIATAGEVSTEIGKAISYLLGMFYGKVGFHCVLYILEALLLLLVFAVTETLLYYTIMSLGQMVKKSRIIASVGMYFGYQVITQVIGVVLTVIIAIVSSNETLMEKLGDYVYAHPISTAHFAIIGIIVFEAILGLVYFLVTRHILMKKLNIE